MSLDIKKLFKAIGATCVLWVLLRMYRAYCKAKKESEMVKNIPGTLSITETLELFKTHNEGMSRFFSERVKAYGKVYKTALFGDNYVCVSDSKIIQQIVKLEPEYVQPGWTPAQLQLLGNAIGTREGDEHTHARLTLLRALNKGTLQEWVPRASTIAYDILLELSARDYFIPNFETTASIVWKLTKPLFLGEHYNLESSELFAKDLQHYSAAFGFVATIDLPFTLFGKGIRAHKSMKTRLIEEIEQRRNGTVKPIRSDVISSYMRLLSEENPSTGNLWTVSELADSLVPIFWASIDSTASTMVMSFLFAAKYPLVMANIKAEAQKRLKQNEPTTEFLLVELESELPYLNAAVKELLRVYFPVMGILRKTRKEMPLEWTDDEGQIQHAIVPPGWRIFHDLFAASESYPEHVREPTVNPERFLREEEKIGMDGCSPFSSGRRQCPGMNVALFELRMFLLHLATKFSVSLENTAEIDFIHAPFIKPAKPFRVKLSHQI